MVEQLTDHHYEVLTVPEQSAANCIYIKGPSKRDFLLHRPADECPDSVAVSPPHKKIALKKKNPTTSSHNPVILGACVQAFQKLQDYTFLPTACSEASKLGASLSSLCLLINKKHTYF